MCGWGIQEAPANECAHNNKTLFWRQHSLWCFNHRQILFYAEIILPFHVNATVSFLQSETDWNTVTQIDSSSSVLFHLSPFFFSLFMRCTNSSASRVRRLTTAQCCLSNIWTLFVYIFHTLPAQKIKRVQSHILRRIHTKNTQIHNDI